MKRKKDVGGTMSQLRETYMKDPEARAFLKAHPELAGFEIESTHDLPSNESRVNRERERSTRAERDLVIQEGLPHYTQDRDERRMLEEYYGGATIEAMARTRGISGNYMRQQVFQARGHVYLWAKMRPWELGLLSPAGIAANSKRFIHGKAERQVYKVGATWITEEWRVLPDEIQDMLDALEWDVVDLSKGETL